MFKFMLVYFEYVSSFDEHPPYEKHKSLVKPHKKVYSLYQLFCFQTIIFMAGQPTPPPNVPPPEIRAS